MNNRNKHRGTVELRRMMLLLGMSLVVLVRSRQTLLSPGEWIPHENFEAATSFAETEDFQCLTNFRNFVNQKQEEWFARKVPILSAVIPRTRRKKNDNNEIEHYLTVIFTTKKLEYNYKEWKRADPQWRCIISTREAGARNGTSTRVLATHRGLDRSHQSIIVDCPGNTTSIEIPPRPGSQETLHQSVSTPAVITYDIPPRDHLCDWKVQPAYISACTMIMVEDAENEIERNESARTWQLLSEWIVYHWLLGVEHFYIYLNGRNSTTQIPDSFFDLLPPHSNNADPIHFIPHHDKLGNFMEQVSMQNDCLIRAHDASRWVLMNDIDEYFQIMMEKLPSGRTHGHNTLSSRLPSTIPTLHDLLHSYDKARIQGVRAKNWWFSKQGPALKRTKSFANKKHRTTMIEKFPWRLNSFTGKGRQKLILRPKYVKYMAVHEVSAGLYPMVELDPTTQLRVNHFKFPLKNEEIPHTKLSQIEYDDSWSSMYGPMIQEVLNQEDHGTFIPLNATTTGRVATGQTLLELELANGGVKA